MQRSILVPTARRVKSETQKVTPKGKRKTSTPKPQSRKAAIPEADQPLPLPFDGEENEDTPSFI